jgi:hypothetical protein
MIAVPMVTPPAGNNTQGNHSLILERGPLFVPNNKGAMRVTQANGHFQSSAADQR